MKNYCLLFQCQWQIEQIVPYKSKQKAINRTIGEFKGRTGWGGGDVVLLSYVVHVCDESNKQL